MAGTKEKKAANKERVLKGLGVSPGISIGPIHVRESGAVEVSEYAIPPKKVDSELTRFSEAVERTRKQLLKLKSKAQTLPEATAEELGYLLDAHLHMLEGSRLIRGVENRISGKFLNAEAAVQAEISEIGKSFAAMEDSYLAARMEDIREVGNRLVRSLTKSPPTAFSTLPKGSIVVAEELTPADTALLDDFNALA